MAKCVAKCCTIEVNEAFYLGAQGPDIFYYYHVFPWYSQEKKQSIQQIGDWIHAGPSASFFEHLFLQARCQNSTMIFDYVKGMLCHYALDHIAHPYIFYETENPSVCDDGYAHRQFETAIDSLLWQNERKYGRIIRPYQVFCVSDELVRQLSKLYHGILQKCYYVYLDSSVVGVSIRNAYDLQRLLYDPNGRKTKSLMKIETYMHAPLQALSVAIDGSARSVTEDVLNKKHRKWRHPVTGKVSTQSFKELFEQSIEQARIYIATFQSYLNDDVSLEEAVYTLGNYSFDTGVCGQQSMQYFKSC